MIWGVGGAGRDLHRFDPVFGAGQAQAVLTRFFWRWAAATMITPLIVSGTRRPAGGT
jgi:hypothetical protein